MTGGPLESPGPAPKPPTPTMPTMPTMPTPPKRKIWDAYENAVFDAVYSSDLPNKKVQTMLFDRGVACSVAQIKSKAQQNRHAEHLHARRGLEEHFRALEVLEELDDRLLELEKRIADKVGCSGAA